MSVLINKGFTLVELLIALAIAAILITLAVPGLQSFLQNNKIVSATNKLSASLNLARLEAVKRGVKVSVCPTANAAFTACGDNTQWSDGWIIFVDADNNNAIEGTDDLVKVAEALSNDATITSPSDIVSYDGSGFLIGANPSFSLTADGCTGNNARTISVSASGHLSIEPAACSS